MDTHGGYFLFKAPENGGVPGFGIHRRTKGGSSGAANPGRPVPAAQVERDQQPPSPPGARRPLCLRPPSHADACPGDPHLIVSLRPFCTEKTCCLLTARDI